MVKISVIIPVYNAAKYLEESLESILNQSFKEYEIICVNDGSEDNSREIVEKYIEKYPRIISLYNQENKGQSAARNLALSYAKGDYIAYIDADDYILPDYLEKLYNMAVEKNSELVICSYKKFLNDGTIVLERNTMDWCISFGEYSHVFMYSPCAKLIKKRMLDKYGIIFSEGEKMEDGPYGIMTNCIAENVQVMDYYGYMYRMYDESTMGGVREKGISVKNNNLKLPMRGLETATKKVMAAKGEEEGYNWVIEYVVLKAVAGFVYIFSAKGDKENLKKVCDWTEKMIRIYFNDINKNPYVKLRSPKGLPFTHRAAVWMLKVTYNLHLLYPFALIYTGVYKNK